MKHLNCMAYLGLSLIVPTLLLSNGLALSAEVANGAAPTTGMARQSDPKVTAGIFWGEGAAASSASRLWEKDATLDKIQINLELKRVSLVALLAQVEQQSGVKLILADIARLKEIRVTVRVADMPLSAFMTSLARTYGLSWERTAPGIYEMRALDVKELDMKLLQAGDSRWYSHRSSLAFNYFRQKDDKNRAAVEALKQVGADSLNDSKGVPFTKLSAELQAYIREQVQTQEAEFLKSTNSVMAPLANSGVLLLHVTPSAAEESTGPLQQTGMTIIKQAKIQIKDANGREVAQLF